MENEVLNISELISLIVGNGGGDGGGDITPAAFEGLLWLCMRMRYVHICS